jgi:glycine cleavage system aminomethyltransferase T
MKQTALHTRFEQSGIGMVDHHGWRVPAFFTSSLEEAQRVSAGVGISDVSWLAKFDLKGPGVSALSGIRGASRFWPLGPRHALVTCQPEAAETSRALLNSVQPMLYLTDVTSVYAAFLLAGPRGRDVLGKLTSLNGPADRQCSETSLAHVHAIILREDFPKMPAFLLLVGREYAESVWDSVLHAGHEFRILPFGVRAHEILAV